MRPPEPRHHWLEAGGFPLSILEVTAAAPARATAIVGHAMMVDRRTVYRSDRPSLVGTLAAAGIDCLVPDLRGHGASQKRGASWSYRELLDDTARYVRFARARWPDRPLALVGNSLFGHLALAYVGLDPAAPVDALCGFAVNIWNRRWTASRRRWWIKLGLVAASAPVVHVLGRLPVRRLGLGSDDEPLGYWRSMLGWVPNDRWGVGDGDELARALGQVRQPFLHVVSEGDRLLSHPDDARLFGAAVPRRELWQLGPHCPIAELSGLSPGHVEMVASPRCEPLWRSVAAWLIRTLDGAQA